MHETGERLAARAAAHAAVGARLAGLGDRALSGAVAASRALGSGIGGRRGELEIAGTPVFVKRVPLTELEARPANAHATANLFGLPLYYQYGVGSAGFGAWRELAAHRMTTAWALGGGYPGFPLLYHWRILPDRPPADLAGEFGGVDGAVAHWEGSPAVRARLEAIGRSSQSLVLFLEHLPATLAARLGDVRGTAAPDGDRDAAYLRVEAQLAEGTRFMSARGLVHFDAHFLNVLTDGRQVYFADFGLALSRDFALSAAEARFLDDHLVYDRSYVPWHLLRYHLPPPVPGGAEHAAFLRAWAAGRRPDGVSPGIGALVDRHARHAAVMDDFARRLVGETKRTPFPAREIRQALDGAGPQGAPESG
ncbi:protein kinase family protein [Streptomyces sp. NPDC020917]|uniref:protein kinase family protein n=1 Tax=Streptomyces sp. NPDC020917 TaxID=3365102 RepID=UPI00378CA708